MRRLALLLALAVVPLSSPGQAPADTGPPLKELLSGKTYPLTIQLKQLDAEWTRLNIGESGGVGGYMAMIMAMFGGGGATGASYTKGQTAILGGETYLVVYRPKSKPLNPALLRGPEPPAPEKLTPDTVLALALVNLRTTNSFTDIRPFDLQQEIAESGGAAEAGAAATGGPAETTSLSNLKQLGLALMMYTQDYDEMLPQMKDQPKLKTALMPYCKNEAIFINPITKKPNVPNAVLNRHRMAQIAAPAEMALFYEDAPAPDGTRAVVFLDGHAKRLTDAEWADVKRKSKIP